jgi:multiple sugar transport system permease protein
MNRLLGLLVRHSIVLCVLALWLLPVGVLVWQAAGAGSTEAFAPLRALIGLRDTTGEKIFEGQLTNSLRVSGAVAVLCFLFAPTAGYALSRTRFPGRWMVLTLFGAALVAPITLLIVPLEIILGTVGLHDTHVGLIVAQLGLAMPLATLILKRAFDRLPPELEEAARLEGASPARIFWTVALPQARDAFVSAFVVAFVVSWGEYLFATTFLSKPDLFTLPAVIVGASRPNLSPWDRFAPMALVAAAPAVLLLVLLQRRLGDLLQLGALAPRAPHDEA